MTRASPCALDRLESSEYLGSVDCCDSPSTCCCATTIGDLRQLILPAFLVLSCVAETYRLLTIGDPCPWLLDSALSAILIRNFLQYRVKCKISIKLSRHMHTQ